MLFISERGMPKSPTIIVDSAIPPCSSIRFCLVYFDALFLELLCLLGELTPLLLDSASLLP